MTGAKARTRTRVLLASSTLAACGAFCVAAPVLAAGTEPTPPLTAAAPTSPTTDESASSPTPSPSPTPEPTPTVDPARAPSPKHVPTPASTTSPPTPAPTPTPASPTTSAQPDPGRPASPGDGEPKPEPEAEPTQTPEPDAGAELGGDFVARPSAQLAIPVEDPRTGVAIAIGPPAGLDPAQEWPQVTVIDRDGDELARAVVDFRVCAALDAQELCARASGALSSDVRTITGHSDLIGRTVRIAGAATGLRVWAGVQCGPTPPTHLKVQAHWIAGEGWSDNDSTPRDGLLTLVSDCPSPSVIDPEPEPPQPTPTVTPRPPDPAPTTAAPPPVTTQGVAPAPAPTTSVPQDPRTPDPALPTSPEPDAQEPTPAPAPAPVDEGTAPAPATPASPAPAPTDSPAPTTVATTPSLPPGGPAAPGSLPDQFANSHLMPVLSGGIVIAGLLLALAPPLRRPTP